MSARTTARGKKGRSHARSAEMKGWADRSAGGYGNGWTRAANDTVGVGVWSRIGEDGAACRVLWCGTVLLGRRAGVVRPGVPELGRRCRQAERFTHRRATTGRTAGEKRAADCRCDRRPLGRGVLSSANSLCRRMGLRYFDSLRDRTILVRNESMDRIIRDELFVGAIRFPKSSIDRRAAYLEIRK